MAPFAFLGSRYDHVLKEFYTTYCNQGYSASDGAGRPHRWRVGGRKFGAARCELIEKVPDPSSDARDRGRAPQRPSTSRWHHQSRCRTPGDLEYGPDRDPGHASCARTDAQCPACVRLDPWCVSTGPARRVSVGGKVRQEMHVDGGTTDNAILLPIQTNIRSLERAGRLASCTVEALRDRQFPHQSGVGECPVVHGRDRRAVDYDVDQAADDWRCVEALWLRAAEQDRFQHGDHPAKLQSAQQRTVRSQLHDEAVPGRGAARAGRLQMAANGRLFVELYDSPSREDQIMRVTWFLIGAVCASAVWAVARHSSAGQEWIRASSLADEAPGVACRKVIRTVRLRGSDWPYHP